MENIVVSEVENEVVTITLNQPKKKMLYLLLYEMKYQKH